MIRLHRPASTKRSRCLPRVEPLEDRAVPSAAPLFQDTFGDNFFDTSKWVSGKTDANGNPIAVREHNQRLEFTGPGSVATVPEFVPSEDEPLEITGILYWAPNPGLVGTAQLFTRSGGDYAIVDGIEFRAEPGIGISIREWEDGEATLLASVPAKIDVGDLFRWRVRDDGFNVSLALMEVDGDGVAVALAAETDLESETNHIAFRYGNVAFAPVARLALDDVVVALGTPPPNPVPTIPPVVTIPPGNVPLIIPAIPLEFWVDDGSEDEGPAERSETARQVKVRRGKLRRTRRGRLRQMITLRNTGATDVTDLRLAFTRLPKNARVRIARDEWVTAAQAARGIELGDHDVLRSGESITVEVEFTNTSPRARIVTRVLGDLEEPGVGSGSFSGPIFDADFDALSGFDPDD